MREKGVFIRDSHEHSVYTYYEGQKGILAFVVEVNASDKGTVSGNLYNISYKELCERVRTAAVPKGCTIIHYEDGERIHRIFYSRTGTGFPCGVRHGIRPACKGAYKKRPKRE